MKNPAIACDSYIPVYSTCMLPVFYALTTCRAVLCLRGMQNVVVIRVLVGVESVFRPVCPIGTWLMVRVLCKTNITENLPETIQNLLSNSGCINCEVVERFQMVVFTISFLFSPSSRNRQRKLGTKLQWSPNFFCVDLEPSSPFLKHTHSYKRSQQNHTGEPFFWTDAVVWSKGQ